MPFRFAFVDISEAPSEGPSGAKDIAPPKAMDNPPEDHLWGYLEPNSSSLVRINLLKIHPLYTIGRGRDSNKVILPGARISNNHCTISWDGTTSARGGVLVTDLSTNGTFIDGQKIGRNRTGILSGGNEITFGPRVGVHQRNGFDDYSYIFHHVAAGSEKSGLHALYDVGEKLGRGTFASVCVAVHRETGVRYAAKMISASKTGRKNGGEAHTYIHREIEIMQQLDHRNICKLVEAYFHDDGSVNLVLELVEGGNLMKYINNTSAGIEEPFARDITYQLCDALAYIHSKGVTHRDLKPENILLALADPPLIKVADFGLAKVVDNTTMLRTLCGTPNYLAPEVMSGSPAGYDNLVDSWSVGVTVFFMLTKQSPFEARRAHELLRPHIMQRQVKWSVLESTKNVLSTEAKKFIERLLDLNPTRRMNLIASMQDPWLLGHIPFHGYVNSATLLADDTPNQGPRSKPKGTSNSPYVRNGVRYRRQRASNGQDREPHPNIDDQRKPPRTSRKKRLNEDEEEEQQDVVEPRRRSARLLGVAK